ncbi:MAG: hypothetical protein QOG58_4787, partial [Caballeronia sp.]|nr:hypothetical protein [Caballeronia sp.]
MPIEELDMNNVTALIAALEAELEADAVLTAESDLAPFTEDWRGRYKGPAAAVVQPSNTSQVSAVVRLCAAYGVPVLPNTHSVSAGTSLATSRDTCSASGRNR